MAGGGGALTVPERQKRGKISRRKKKKRLGFRIDMTPLVDITFLLLTFFMFTTTMLKPQTIEMKVPPQRLEQVQVRESDLLTIAITDDGKTYYFRGRENPDSIGAINYDDLSTEQKILLKKLGMKDNDLKKKKVMILAIMENLKPINKKEQKLITQLKVSSLTKYNKVIDVIDELNLAETIITDEVTKETETDEFGNQVPMKRKRKFNIVQMREGDSLLQVLDPKYRIQTSTGGPK